MPKRFDPKLLDGATTFGELGSILACVPFPRVCPTNTSEVAPVRNGALSTNRSPRGARRVYMNLGLLIR